MRVYSFPNRSFNSLDTVETNTIISRFKITKKTGKTKDPIKWTCLDLTVWPGVPIFVNLNISGSIVTEKCYLCSKVLSQISPIFILEDLVCYMLPLSIQAEVRLK